MKDEFLHTFEDFRTQVMKYIEPWLDRDPKASVLTDQQMVQLRQACLDEDHDQIQVKPEDELKKMTEFLHAFPNLNSVRTFGGSPNYSSTEKAMIFWPKYVMIERTAWGDQAILKALSTVSIGILCLQRIGWPAFARPVLKQSLLSITGAYGNLQRLNLGLSKYKPPSNAAERNFEKSFSAFLSLVKSNLEHLTLHCGTPPYRQFFSLTCLSQSIFDFYWPKMTSLSLCEVCLNEDEAIRFLSEHKASLFELNLGEMIVTKVLNVNKLGVRAKVEDLGSVISLFWRIPSCCDLQEARLLGRWSNGCTEAWGEHFDDYIRKNTLREKLEKYLCKKGDWPFLHLDVWRPLAARRLELRRKLINPKRPIASDWSDKSWVWDYELFDYDFY